MNTATSAIPHNNLRWQQAYLTKFKHSIKTRMSFAIGIIVITFCTLFSLLMVAEFKRFNSEYALHEGRLFADSLAAVIAEPLAVRDVAKIQSIIQGFLEVRGQQDVELNIITLDEPGRSSRVIASNNPDNLEDTDADEHALIEAAVASREVLMELDIEDGDDEEDELQREVLYKQSLTPGHPDFHFEPGYQIIDIFVPVFFQQQGIGAINIKLSLKSMELTLGGIYIHMMLGLFCMVLLILSSIAFISNRNLVLPLQKLSMHMHLFGIKRLNKPSNLAARKDEWGFIAKQFNLMRSRIEQAEAVTMKYQEHLQEMVEVRTQQLMQTQDVTFMSIGALAETRDPETGGHIKRTQTYVKTLAEALRTHPRFQSFLSQDNIEQMYKSAPLHDIGKVGIPDSILLKPGKLNDDEFEIMKTHTTLGGDALAAAEQQLGSNSFLRFAKEIAYYHQEKWDGSGYPKGLTGEEIPVSARLMAVADVYDALISRRCYKPPFSHQRAVSIIKEGKGTHFDPDMVEAFVEIAESFRQIALTYCESDEEHAALM
ncbi:MAG: HD domain-containing phosphohydrolase [Aestuariibacter sp.]